RQHGAVESLSELQDLLAYSVQHLCLGGLHLELGRSGSQRALIATLQQLIKAQGVGALGRASVGGGEVTRCVIQIELLAAECQRRIRPHGGGQLLCSRNVYPVAGSNDRQVVLQEELFGRGRRQRRRHLHV